MDQGLNNREAAGGIDESRALTRMALQQTDGCGSPNMQPRTLSRLKGVSHFSPFLVCSSRRYAQTGSRRREPYSCTQHGRGSSNVSWKDATMWSLELHALVKREHYRDYLAEVEQDRLARMLRPVPLHHALARRLLYHVAHRMTMPLGRALLGSAWLYCSGARLSQFSRPP